MKLKRFCLVLTVALLLLALPMSALALTENKNGASSARGGVAGTEKQAREYVIKFGVEHALGEHDKYPIYSAPDLNAVRGANGKAMLATSGGADSALPLAPRTALRSGAE